MVRFIDHVEGEEFLDMEEEIFYEEDHKMNQEIYKLARFMIIQLQMVETPIFYPSSNDYNVSVSTGDDIVVPSPSELHRLILTLKELHDRNTPLHAFLCAFSVNTTIMKIIFECCPIKKSSEMVSATARDLVQMRDSGGCTPLHSTFSVRTNCPFSSLKLMLQYCSPCDEANGLDLRLLRKMLVTCHCIGHLHTACCLID